MPRPSLACLLLLILLLHASCTTPAAAAVTTTTLPGTAEPDDSDSVQLLRWVNETEGGLVHETLSVRRLGPGFRGIFATGPVKKGETLAVVPWSLCVTFPMNDATNEHHCGLSLKVLDDLVKADVDNTPYVKYLRDFDPQLPNDWPPNARRALDGLPPNDWDRHLEWFEGSNCLGRKSTEEERRAMYLMVSRSASSYHSTPGSGYLFLAPFYDMMSHRNGRYHNARVDVEAGESVRISAERDIASGEEIYLTYGEGTVRIFRDYGFVEPLPRVWDLVTDISFIEDEEGRVRWPASGPPRGEAREEFLGRLATLKRALAAPMPDVIDEAEAELLAKAADFVRAMAGAIDAAVADLSNNQLTGEL